MPTCNQLHIDHYPSSLVGESSSNSDSEDDDEENQETCDAAKQQLGCFICPNESDPITIKKAFMEKHPIQVVEGKGTKLPFEPSKLYYRHLPSGEKIHRKWLSYSVQLNKLYCSCCMAFGDKGHRDSTFITGYDVSSKNVYKSVEIHENSTHHGIAAKAAFQNRKGYDISTLLNTNQTKQQKIEIQTRRLVIQRLIDIVLFIGRQGIAFFTKSW